MLDSLQCHCCEGAHCRVDALHSPLFTPLLLKYSGMPSLASHLPSAVMVRKRGSSTLSVWHWSHVFGLGRSANSRTHLSALQSTQMLQPWLQPSVRASQAGGAQVWPLWVVVDWCTWPKSWFLFPLSPIHVSSLISSPEYNFQCHLHIKLCWLYFPFTHRHTVQIVSNFCDVINTWKHAW